MPLSLNFGQDHAPDVWQGKPKTPITLISGFLGSGKTCLLKNLLQNQDGVRIGVVVNDVAAVNIDSQMVKRFEKGHVEVAELQNGCVCCSSADDLFSAVQSMVMRSGHFSFEHIVVELSGVGEPAAIKRNWNLALSCNIPAALRTEVARVVTVLDASTFGSDWYDTKRAETRNEDPQGDRHDESNKSRHEPVSQLLAEQIEWADVIIINKVDIAQPHEVDAAEQLVAGINGAAHVCHSSFGDVAPMVILPEVPDGLCAPDSGRCEGCRWEQTPDSITIHMHIGPAVKARDIEFKLRKQTICLRLRHHDKPSVSGTLHAEIKNLDSTLFEIDGSGEDRHATVVLEKRAMEMWPDLWKKSATANTQLCLSCEDPKARDIFLDSRRLSNTRFGFHSFVFQRRRPFAWARLKLLLASWPLPNKASFSITDIALDSHSPDRLQAFAPILRSKGFCWLDSEPLRQHEWAHAGKSLNVSPLDWWWAALDAEQLNFKITYPGVEAEYKSVLHNKWDSVVGDRRQELVFIGGPSMREATIVSLLEECLLSDDELEEFWTNSATLRVPNDDFSIKGLLRTLGAGEDEISDLGEARRNHSKQPTDDEETDLLRALGVGAGLEERIVSFEAVD